MTFSRLLGALAPATTLPVSIAFLILRIVVGWSLHLHGAPKLHDPFHWLDNAPPLHSAVPAPAFLEPVVAFVEGIGGLLIVAGLLTRVLAIIAVFDLATVVIGIGMMQGHPFVGGRESYEVPALLLTVMLAFVICGPGRFSLDALIARRR